eukprot:symbB.v1.2.021490.t1/scaffold1806.1/size131321/5
MLQLLLAPRDTAGGRSEQAHFLEALEVLDQPQYEQFDDFLEMVIEFGYVTLFASAFPLAAAMSVVSNVIELKSDIFKLALVYQRPMPHRMKSIGIWRQLLHLIAAVSIITNIMIFVMSEQLASWVPSLYREASVDDVHQGRLASAVDEATGTADLVIRQGAGRYVIFAAVVLEHLVGAAVMILMAAIPREPDWVRCEIRRTRVLKQWGVMPSPPTVPATETDAEASAAPPLEEPKDIDESEDRRLEDLRLARLEDELLSRLERLGSLSLAEESRLNDLRRQRAAIKAS